MSMFQCNSTNLSRVEPIEVPMAEGFSFATGIGDALMEGAKSDMEFFNFMLESDIKLMHANSDGEVFTEAEGIIGKIIEKIVGLFKFIIGKFKAIAATISLKWIELSKKDGEIINKYAKDFSNNKEKINKIQVKFRKPKDNGIVECLKFGNGLGDDYDYTKHSESQDERVKYYATCDTKDLKDRIYATYFDTVLADIPLSEVKFGSANGIDAVTSYFVNGRHNVASFATESDKVIKNIERLMNNLRSNKKAVDTNIEQNYYQKCYDMVAAYRDFMLLKFSYTKDCIVDEYKQNHSALIKAVGVVIKKEATLLESIIEEANYIVEDTFNEPIDIIVEPEDPTDPKVNIQITADDNSNDVNIKVSANDASEYESPMEEAAKFNFAFY